MFFSLSKQMIEKNREFYLSMYDKEHLLIQFDRLIDWDYIKKEVMQYYSMTPIGRPTVDPVILVKILFIQYLEGFRSVRFTCKQIKSNATYRWFLGIFHLNAIPNHSTISRFLWKRLKGENFWGRLFEEQLHAINGEGFIANETWAADEMEFKANANKRTRQKQPIRKDIEENQTDLATINAFRVQHGKKPLQPKEPKVIYHPTNLSPIDEDARLSVKHVERGQFAYFEHRVVDTLHGFILATEVTSANVPGHRILIGQVDHLKEVFGAYAGEITLNAGYYNARCANALFERDFFVSMPYKAPRAKEHPKCKRVQFKEINETMYCCPMGIAFHYTTSTRQGYHEFKAPKEAA